MKYHKPTQMFYIGDREVDAPEDAIIIPKDEEDQIMGQLNAGKILRIENDEFVFYEPSNPPIDCVMDALRNMRGMLLSRSDWTQIPDAPIPAETRAAWAIYRQALRDFPETCTDPRNPQWPTPPL